MPVIDREELKLSNCILVIRNSMKLNIQRTYVRETRMLFWRIYLTMMFIEQDSDELDELVCYELFLFPKMFAIFLALY